MRNFLFALSYFVALVGLIMIIPDFFSGKNIIPHKVRLARKGNLVLFVSAIAYLLVEKFAK